MDKRLWKKPLTDEELLIEAENVYNDLTQQFDLPIDNNFDTDEEESDDEEIVENLNVVSVLENFELENEETESLETIENEESVNPVQQKTKKQLIEIDRKWRKKNFETIIPEYDSEIGAAKDIFAACRTPTDVLLKFLDPILDNLLYQSNLYAVQRNKVLNVKKGELLAFIGINQFMGYHVLPSWRHYWSSSPDLGASLVKETMSRLRFDNILSNLHVNDNSTIPPNNKDKLYKLRPLIEALNVTFHTYYKGTREISIDESMIAFKGRSSIKQYNPMKPIKRGYKIWACADQKGYILQFDIYQGKVEEESAEFQEFGLGEKVVLKLTKNYINNNRIVYFDNFFTSIPLLEKLKVERTLACGTIRSTRKGTPKNMIDDKKLKRGDFDYRFSSMGIGFFKWKDNKVVHLASNFHGNETAVVKRKQKDGTSLEIPCPTIVNDYNNNMGGVDHADQLRSTYGLNRRSKKWWHKIFFGLLDITFVNAYVVYCNQFEKISLLEFRRAIAMGLMSKRPSVSTTRKRLSQENNRNSPQVVKRRKKNFSVSPDVRLSNRGIHWVKYVKERGRCEVCSKKQVQSRPHSKCSTCNIFLCCNEKKNCMAEYHEMSQS